MWKKLEKSIFKCFWYFLLKVMCMCEDFEWQKISWNYEIMSINQSFMMIWMISKAQCIAYSMEKNLVKSILLKWQNWFHGFFVKCGNYGHSLSRIFGKNVVKVTFFLKEMIKPLIWRIFFFVRYIKNFSFFHAVFLSLSIYDLVLTYVCHFHHHHHHPLTFPQILQ